MPDLNVLEAHDHGAPDVVEGHVYNIPLDVVPVPAEVVEAAPPVAAELVNEHEDVLEADLEPETLEDDAPVEQEPEIKDPDAPQQLSLF